MERILHLVDTGRLDPTKPITVKSFIDAGINGVKDGVKILGSGHHHFKLPVEIHATRFTKSAIKAIEEAGGKAVSVFHSDAGLRQLKNPERFWRKDPEKAMAKLEAPSRLRDRLFYSDPKTRGYLAPPVLQTLTEEFKSKYSVPN